MIIKKTAIVMLLKWISSRKIFKNTDQHVLSLGNKTNILWVLLVGNIIVDLKNLKEQMAMLLKSIIWARSSIIRWKIKYHYLFYIQKSLNTK